MRRREEEKCGKAGGSMEKWSYERGEKRGLGRVEKNNDVNGA